MTVWGTGVDPSHLSGNSLFSQAELGSEAPSGFPEAVDYVKAISNKSDANDNASFVVKKVSYRVYRLPYQQDDLETLMTRLAHGEGCVICREDYTFTKEGDYVVVVKWMDYEVGKTQHEDALEKLLDPHSPIDDESLSEVS